MTREEQDAGVAARDRDLLVADAKVDFCDQRTQPLECICAGLSRTGTTSLLEAFAILGYGTVYNSRETLRRKQERFASAALDAKYSGRGPGFGLEQYESLWGSYRVISGEVVACVTEEVLDLYPDAKVVLSVRADERRWLRSLLDTMWYNHTRWATGLAKRVDPRMRDMRHLVDRFWAYKWAGDPVTHGLRVYREHNAMVKRKVAPERLLVYDTAEGWGPLCEFLGKEVPDVPFPHVNRTWEHRRIFGGIRRAALRSALLRLLTQGVLPAVVVWLVMIKRAGIWGALRSLMEKK